MSVISVTGTVNQGDSVIVVDPGVDLSNVPSSSWAVIQNNKIVKITGGTGIVGGTSTLVIDGVYPATLPNVAAVPVDVFSGFDSIQDIVNQLNTLVNDSAQLKADFQTQIDGQGTAAALDVTTSTTDTTADSVLKTGDAGILGNAIPVTDWDNDQYNGFYSSNSAQGQSNSPNDAAVGWQGVTTRLNFQNVRQIVWVSGGISLDIYSRAGDPNAGVFGDWKKMLHSGNLGHFQNVSGGTISSALTVSGSGLNPAQSGTWRNVSGGDIFNTGYGLWELV